MELRCCCTVSRTAIDNLAFDWITAFEIASLALPTNEWLRRTATAFVAEGRRSRRELRSWSRSYWVKSLFLVPLKLHTDLELSSNLNRKRKANEERKEKHRQVLTRKSKIQFLLRNFAELIGLWLGRDSICLPSNFEIRNSIFNFLITFTHWELEWSYKSMTSSPVNLQFNLKYRFLKSKINSRSLSASPATL